MESIARRILLENGCALNVYADSDIDEIEKDVISRFGEGHEFDDCGKKYDVYDIAQAIMDISMEADSLTSPVYVCYGLWKDEFGERSIVHKGEVRDDFYTAHDDMFHEYMRILEDMDEEKFGRNEFNDVIENLKFAVFYGEDDEQERRYFCQYSEEELQHIGWCKR